VARLPTGLAILRAFPRRAIRPPLGFRPDRVLRGRRRGIRRVQPQPPPQLGVFRLQGLHPRHQPHHQHGKLLIRRLRRFGRGHNPDDRRSKTPQRARHAVTDHQHPTKLNSLATAQLNWTREWTQDISTVEFALDGVTYELDLTDDNSAKLRDALSQYARAGRKIGGRHRSGRRPDRATSSNGGATGYNRETLKSIREWAKNNGHSVSDRGRLSAQVLQAWETAQASMSKA
jgi:hypothetical protein